MPNDDISTGLAPLGGGSPPAPVTPPAPTLPMPAPVATAPTNPTAPSRFASPPTTGTASRFDAPPSPAPVSSRPSAPRDEADEDDLPAGRIAGSLAAGLVVGAVCLAGWLWFVQTLSFNLSFIAVGVGFAIGFAVGAVAQKDNPFTIIAAGLLGIGFSVAGVWSSFSGGSVFGIIFGVLCILLGGGAAIKAASVNPDTSDDD
ncbi:MAG: hypothetical protein H7Y38_17395 [Armatimonadetes bacterium]|nr:hypothetical protein [Armatimonadota bacterium]